MLKVKPRWTFQFLKAPEIARDISSRVKMEETMTLFFDLDHLPTQKFKKDFMQGDADDIRV